MKLRAAVFLDRDGVLSDEFEAMRREALELHSWQDNVYVKVPITNSRGDCSLALIRELSSEGVKVNVTAILTLQQVEGVAALLCGGVPAIVSVFAGRIADTGLDPAVVMRRSKEIICLHPHIQLLWASVREVLNIYQAEETGCDIVTVPHEILMKAMRMAGQDLTDLSLETVQMFRNDALSAGYSL